MTSEYAEIKRLEREIEKARIAQEHLEDLNKQLEAEIKRASEINKQLEAGNERLETEAATLRRSLEQIESELQRSRSESADLRRSLAMAKDPNPVKRFSVKRVQALASNACMETQRLRSGWLLKFGRLERRFRSLGQIWQILIQEDWALSDLFPREEPKQRPRLPFRYPVLAAR